MITGKLVQVNPKYNQVYSGTIGIVIRTSGNCALVRWNDPTSYPEQWIGMDYLAVQG